MKRMAARVAYMAGSIIALRSIVWGLAGSFGDAVTGIAIGVAWWWIAVGIGVRLGVHPRDFFASLGAALGLSHEDENLPRN